MLVLSMVAFTFLALMTTFLLCASDECVRSTKWNFVHLVLLFIFSPVLVWMLIGIMLDKDDI